MNQNIDKGGGNERAIVKGGSQAQGMKKKSGSEVKQLDRIATCDDDDGKDSEAGRQADREAGRKVEACW